MHEIERVYLMVSTGLRQKEEVQEILGLYFDGKIDKTLLQVKDDEGFMHHNIIKEDHITILTKPESQYLSHITPLGGSGKEISSAILECLQRMNVDATSIAAVGCDGTVVNTGHKSGAVRLLEESLEKTFTVVDMSSAYERTPTASFVCQSRWHDSRTKSILWWYWKTTTAL